MNDKFTEEELTNAQQVFDVFVQERQGVSNCTRCGCEHEYLPWTKFSREVQIENSLVLGWAICPVNDEPLLFIVGHGDDE